VKALLSREGVPFTAYNVDEDDRAYDELVARGFRTIPVTIFDDRPDVVDVVIRGFDEPALRSAIARWRASGGERKPADSQ
jgi:glutaredoxin